MADNNHPLPVFMFKSGDTYANQPQRAAEVEVVVRVVAEKEGGLVSQGAHYAIW